MLKLKDRGFGINYLAFLNVKYTGKQYVLRRFLSMVFSPHVRISQL